MSKLARMEAELALMKLEAEFAEKKAAGDLSNEDKLVLREARQKFREEHRQPKPGASVDAIGAKAEVNE